MAGMKKTIAEIGTKFTALGVDAFKKTVEGAAGAFDKLTKAGKDADGALDKAGKAGKKAGDEIADGADRGRSALGRLGSAGAGIGLGVGRGVSVASRHLTGLIKQAGLASTALAGIGSALGIAAGKNAFDDTIEDMQGVRKIAALTNSDVKDISFIQNLGGQAGIDRDDTVGILSGFNSAATEAVRDPTSEFGKSFKDAGIQLTVTPQLDKEEFERQWKAARAKLSDADMKLLQKEERALQTYRDSRGTSLTAAEQQRLLQEKAIALGEARRTSATQEVAKGVSGPENGIDGIRSGGFGSLDSARKDLFKTGTAETGETAEDLADDVKLVGDAFDNATKEAEQMERAFKAAQPPAKKLVDQFFDLADATARMDQAQKGEFLAKIFGDDDSAKVSELLDTIAANRERLGPLYRQMLESDQLITEQQVEIAKTYQRQTGVLAQSIASIKRLFFVKVAPEVGAFIDTVSKTMIKNAGQISDYFADKARDLLAFVHDAVQVFTGFDLDPERDIRFTWLVDLKQDLLDAYDFAKAFARDVVVIFTHLFDRLKKSPIAQALGLQEMTLETGAGIGLKGFVDGVFTAIEKVVGFVTWLRDEVRSTVAYVKTAWLEATEVFSKGGDLSGTTTTLSGLFFRLIELADLVDRFGQAFKAVFVDGASADQVEKGFAWMVSLRTTLESLGGMLERLGQAFAFIKPAIDGIDSLTERFLGFKASVAALGLVLLNGLAFGLIFKSLGGVLGLLGQIGKAALGIRFGGAAAGLAEGAAGVAGGLAKGAGKGAAPVAAAPAKSIAGDVAGGAASGLAEAAAGKIKGAFTAAADASKKALGGIASFGSSVFGKIGGFAKSAGTAVVAGSGTIASAVGGYFKNMGEVAFKVTDYISLGFLSGTGNALKSVGEKAVDLSKSFGETLYKAVGSVATPVADVAKSMSGKLVDAAKAGASSVTDLAGKFSGKLVDAIKGSGGEAGLLKKTLEGVKGGLSWLTAGFVEDTFGLLKSGVGRVIDSIAGPSGLVAAFGKIPGAARGAFTAATTALTGWLTSIGVSAGAAAAGTGTAVLAGGAVVGAGIGYLGAKILDDNVVDPRSQRAIQDEIDRANAAGTGVSPAGYKGKPLYVEPAPSAPKAAANLAPAKVGEIDARGSPIVTDQVPVVFPNGMTMMAPPGTTADDLQRAARMRTTR